MSTLFGRTRSVHHSFALEVGRFICGPVKQTLDSAQRVVVRAHTIGALCGRPLRAKRSAAAIAMAHVRSRSAGTTQPQLDAALGAFIGACTGDAAGAVLEFSAEAERGSIPAERVDWALSMPGGGVHRVAPGQITDDSELAICLAQGLLTAKPPDLPLESIARNNAVWYGSGPVDIGNTCKVAFAAGSQALARGEPIADSTIKAAQDSMASQANGALMRATPLAIWLHRQPEAEIASCAALEARLSHPSQICQDANAAYCLAVASLIRRPGDADAAVAAATQWTEAHACEDVKAWLRDALGRQPLPSVAEQSGWVRWGFLLSFRHLSLGSSFEEALRDTLARGGDVDTNAAIVGGLLGARHGAPAIPAAWREPVLSRGTRAGGEGRARPDFLAAHQVPGLAYDLYHLA